MLLVVNGPSDVPVEQDHVAVHMARRRQYLGVSNDTVYKWIDKHGMPAHRMGRLWKFKKSQVDAWVESGGAAENAESVKNRGGQDES